MRKRIFLVLLTIVFVVSALTAGTTVFAEPVDGQDVQEAPASSESAMALFDEEVYNYKVIRSLSAAYDQAEWEQYFTAGSAILSFDREHLTDDNVAFLESLAEQRAALTQIKDYEDCRWYIWGDDMPVTEEESELEFTLSSFDNADFRPYLIPYLMEDQSQTKGNIILIADGGYTQRVDFRKCIYEFLDRNYNVYELARRVAPYGQQDIWLDLQRAVRYLKYYGEEKGIAALDNLIAGGFSGGSMTVVGTIATAYGNITPDQYDADYTPDEVDALNSDFDTALCIYGPIYDNNNKENFSGIETDNENLPAMFIAGGAIDPIFAPTDNMTLFNSVADKTVAELYIFASTPHGFGTGVPLTESAYWPELADSFMQQIYRNKTDDTASIADPVDYGKIPEEYTQYQQYTANGGFGMADVTCAINDDGSKFFLFFEALGMQNVLAGWVAEDGSPICRYDRTGFSPATTALFTAADPDAWMPIDDSLRQ